MTPYWFPIDIFSCNQRKGKGNVLQTRGTASLTPNMGSIKTFITVDRDIPALNHQTGPDLKDLYDYGFDYFEVFNPTTILVRKWT